MADITKTITVNGVSHTVTCDSTTPLLWVLRDIIGLTGTKFGCGIEECYACTVLLNGSAEKSCDEDMAEIPNGSVITTIEGLSPDGSHPLQKAWVALDVPQCGYCQTGQLMTAAALLARTPKPTDEQIAEAMINICRCGTYNRIKAGIKQAAGIAG